LGERHDLEDHSPGRRDGRERGSAVQCYHGYCDKIHVPRLEDHGRAAGGYNEEIESGASTPQQIALRVMLVLQVEEHVGMIRISYKYNQAILIIKPLILVVSFLAFYTVCIVVARVQSSNNPGKPQ
jgi:hypothetical protein